MESIRPTFLLMAISLALQVSASAQQIEVTHTPLEKLVIKAKTGDAESEFILGNRYYLGKGVTKDFAEAAKWFRNAAEQGFAKAQYNLGFCYSKGQGVTKDEIEAVKWYRNAAEQNLAIAQTKLGVCCEKGRGLSKDIVEAVKWYRKAAEQNFPLAQFNLGRCYAKGVGVTQDDAEAASWYRKAADQRFPMAQNQLGVCYANGAGVAKDRAEAFKWYRLAAEQNLAVAQYNLASYYAAGVGVAKNASEAVKWYRKAAEQKFKEAEVELALCYANGRGVARNDAETVKWLQAAISQDDPRAKYLLGLSYLLGGQLGKDVPKALELFVDAARQNFAEAQSILALIYYEGESVTKNYLEAYAWSLLAARQGDQDGKRYAALLEAKMTPEQIAEGQKRAASFRPRVPRASEEENQKVVHRGPTAFGSGFFITDDGYLITNHHVIAHSKEVQISTAAGTLSAKVVKVDVPSDLALLKIEGTFSAIPIAQSRPVKLGDNVATIGFPNVDLQGLSPKLSRGEIASLSGFMDDARYFQISVAVQPGNSGGALVDEHGNVVGVVSAKLDAGAALRASGALPENVNYAVKSSFLLAFLESMPEMASKLKEPSPTEIKFSEIVEHTKNASALVLVYQGDTTQPNVQE